MCRWTEALVVGAVVLAVCGGAAAQSLDEAEEQVSSYLDEIGAVRLLAEQLEARLEAAKSDRKVEIAARLASVYETLLGAVEDPVEQREWERRSELLLERVPEADSAGLRLSLARAAYDRLEGVMKAWRLRTLDAEGMAQMEETSARFAELEDRLADIAQDAHTRIRTFERQEESGRGFDLDLLDEAIELARQHRSLAHYLAGWCAYHVAELERDPGRARRSMEHFGWLLNAEQGSVPEIPRLPDQLLNYEHIARSVLAVAMCESVRGRTRQATDWLDAAEASGRLAPGIAEQIVAVRLVILARGERWAELEELASRHVLTSPLGAAQARLLAIWTLEADAETPGEEELIGRVQAVAIGELVATGQLAQVLDLSQRYDLDTGESDSFLSRFVRGLDRYDRARKAQRAAGEDGSKPSQSSVVAQLFADAAIDLIRARRAPDAGAYGAVAGQTAHLIGVCLFHAPLADASSLQAIGAADPLLAAADWFATAGDELTDPSHVAGAHWMVVRSLDERLKLPGATQEMVERRVEAAEAFLEDHPQDDRASALVLERASDAEPSETVLHQLLSVPEDSAMRESARRRAARMAYELFRDAGPQDRSWQGARYLSLAEPLLAVDRRRAGRGDAEAAGLAVHRARRMIEVILATEPPDLARAERTLDTITSLIASGQADGADLGPELKYRSAQIALHRGDTAKAERLVGELRDADPELARASARMFYNYALREWRRAERTGADPVEHAAGVARHGQRVLDDMSGEGVEETNAAFTSVRFNVGEALMVGWEAHGDAAALGRALEVYRALVALFPSDRRALEGLGGAARASSLYDVAMESYRTLIAGVEAGSEEWFRYRVFIVETLLEHDVERGRAVLKQHVVLYPDFGPAPWGDRLRELSEAQGMGGGE